MTVNRTFINGTVVTPEGVMGPNAGVAVDDEKIVAVGHSDVLPESDEVIDLDGNFVAPGIIDCHVHVREPGAEERGDWVSATRSAAAGGVTSIIAMPNTDPFIDRPEHLEQMFDLIAEKAVVDAVSYGLVTSDNIEYLQSLADAGVPGFKCFLYSNPYYDFGTPDDGELLAAMEEIAATGKRIGFHQENTGIVNYQVAKFQREGRNEPIDHHKSRLVVSEVEPTQRVILFSEVTGCPVHMFHQSAGTAAEKVVEAKRRGIDVTAETMPHYLQFTLEAAREKGNTIRINTPLRTKEEQDKLWEIGVHGEGVDCFATDHAPFEDHEKGMDDIHQNTWNVLSGFVGLESAVPAFLTMVDEGRLSMEQWVDLHSAAPAKIWGMYPEKGSLQIGTDADLTVFDPAAQWRFDRNTLESTCTVTPYHGESFTGRVEMTVVRGEVVYDRAVAEETGESGVVGEQSHGNVIDVE